jgi:hypothetical protein
MKYDAKTLLQFRLLVVIIKGEAVAAFSPAGDDDLGGAMLLQAMQTRVSSSVSVFNSVWNGVVVDEMGEALMQKLKGHPAHTASPPAPNYGKALTEPTPPPPPADPIWKSPMPEMPVVSHQKAVNHQNQSKPLVNQSSVEPALAADVSAAPIKSEPIIAEESEPVNSEQKNSETLPGRSRQVPPNDTPSNDTKSGEVSPDETKRPRVLSPMMARTAIREHHTGCKHGVSEMEHHSIFKLPFQDLDSLLFWGIFTGMLFFTIIIDRCENALARMAAKSKTETMLLQRVNAELMMFGIVGLGLFIGTNIFTDIPAEFFRVFEFTDILCSLGACGLIGIASVLFVLRRVMERRWTVLEQSIEGTQDLVLSANSINDSQKILVDQTTLRQKEYFVMSRKFIKHQKIPPNFVYCDYLQECLAKNVCALMDINPLSWCFLLGISIAGLIFKAYASEPLSNSDHLLAFVMVIWSTLVAFLYLMWEVNTARSSLRRNLDISHSLQCKLFQTEHAAGEEHDFRPPDHPKDHSWAWRVNQLLQSLSLFTAFQGAFYLMHMNYNITVNQFHWAWRFVSLLPILWNLCFMLPMIISRFTLVEAYFTPEHDAVDAVLTMMKQHDEDLRYFYSSWVHSGRPTFVDPGMHITFVEFSRVLKRHGMQASEERRQRVFNNLAKETPGVMDLMTLLDELIALDDREQAASAHVSPRLANGSPEGMLKGTRPILM